MKIVIVDDEPKIRNGLRALLNGRQNLEVTGVFENAQTALMELQELCPDIVITDIKMPGYTGLDLIAHIREKNIDTEIIIISGFSEFKFAQRAIELGVYRYLTKPTNPRELLNVIQEISEKKSTKATEKKTDVQENIPNLLVRKAVDYIELNFANKISLKDVAAELYISPNYLSELFKRYMGQNLSEYILNLRMKKAKEYLLNPKYKVSEVSEMTGFQDSRYFSNSFKKVVGMTPVEYKNCNMKREQ